MAIVVEFSGETDMTASMRFCRILGLAWALGCVASAEEPTLPTFRSFAGSFLASGDHNYFVESELRFPVLQLAPASLSYHYRESTPFLRDVGGPQAELLYRRQEAEVDFKLNDSLRLITLAGFEQTDRVDRNGLVSAYALGGGIGSPARRDGERLNWSLVAGGYLSRKNLPSEWWMDGDFAWRFLEFGEQPYIDSRFRPSLSLEANVETVNGGGRFQPLLKIGPALQLLTANGNRAQLQLMWYHNDNNPFYGRDEDGMLFGLDITSSLNTNYVFNARTQRTSGWLPLVWGAYDVGIGATRRLSRFEMNVELFDILVREQLFTGFVWYESRQEYRLGDFDNIAYSVSLGMQTPVGLASIASHDDPLVVGWDFLHRSDHSLAPDAARVPPEGIDNGSHNLLPRLRLQTTGWDLPYRDPSIYRRRTDWLNLFDWRVTAGWDVNDDRPRSKWAGQLGLNWDVATLQGYVVYARGLVSAGNETPDWLGELGVRRPAGKVFTRFENYGIKSDIARGETWVVGFGVYL
jgi:hypothetical protein